jgi:hypothetical protein
MQRKDEALREWRGFDERELRLVAEVEVLQIVVSNANGLGNVEPDRSGQMFPSFRAPISHSDDI